VEWLWWSGKNWEMKQYSKWDSYLVNLYRWKWDPVPQSVYGYRQSVSDWSGGECRDGAWLCLSYRYAETDSSQFSLLKLSTTPRRRIGERRYKLHAFLTSALDRDDWSASCPCRFTDPGKSPSTDWIGGWAGSRAGLDAVVKRKIPSPRQESNRRTPIVQPEPCRYTDWAIPAALNYFNPPPRKGFKFYSNTDLGTK
jgi:hypothetical protein